MAAGQPTKFNKEVERQALLLAAKGFTDKEMAEVLNITEQTFNNWKKAHPKFFESLKRAKVIRDSRVERSLYERACGYEHPEDKIFCNNGKIVTQETTKHYPPDPTSMIFWLKNTQPKKWRDRQELDVNVGLKGVTDKEIDKEIRALEADEKAKGAQTPLTKGKVKA